MHVTHRPEAARHACFTRPRHHQHRPAALQLSQSRGVPAEPHFLAILVDFMLGESVSALARKHYMAEYRVEQALRSALARYDFSAAYSPPQRASPRRGPTYP